MCVCVCNKTHMKSNKCRAFNVSLKWCILTLKKAMLLTGGHEVVSIKILSFAKRCIRYSLPNLINQSPTCITDKLLTHSLQGLSHYAKHHALTKYSSECNVLNCYICR